VASWLKLGEGHGGMNEAEQTRLRALDAARVWQTPAEERFDGIAMLAATVAHARVGLVSFTGEDRTWFKARHGTEERDTARELSPCEEVIRAGAPVIAEEPRLYAGYPVWFDGQVVGAVSVADDEPRTLSAAQRGGLHALARQVEGLLEMRRAVAPSEPGERRLHRLELLTRNALDAFLFLDAQGGLVDFNERALDLYGYTRSEMLQLNVRDLRAPGHSSGVQQVLDNLTEQGAHLLVKHHKKNGTLMDVEVSATSLSSSQREAERVLARSTGEEREATVFSTVRDLSERTRAARVDATNEVIIDHLGDAVVITDLLGRVLQWSTGATALFGYDRESMVGQTLQRLGVADDAPIDADVREMTLWALSGAEVPVERSSNVVRYPDGALAAFVHVFRDIHARLERERALERAKSAAEEANRLKSRFLRNMSHELRTPLNAVLGFARVLQRERHGKLSAEQASYVNDMVDGGEHMLRLVNDLLDLQWVEEGRARLDRRLISSKTVGEDAVRLVRQMAHDRDQRVTVAFASDGDLLVRVDRGRLVQVLVNLLSNAIKFTAPGGHIRLTIEASARAATFAVEDDGIGISEADQPRVFEEFARVGDTAHSRGLGLGLALSKRLVEEHGGTIRVTSALGVGSRFVVTVPRAEANAA
jgi:PAS domain S-box-containing protein